MPPKAAGKSSGKKTKKKTTENSDTQKNLGSKKVISNKDSIWASISESEDDVQSNSSSDSDGSIQDLLKKVNKKTSRGTSNPLATETEEQIEDNIENLRSKKIITRAITVLKNPDESLGAYKASYLLTAIGTALLRTDDVRNKSKAAQDPLAFKIDSLIEQLLKNKSTVKVIRKKKSSSLDKLEQQYKDASKKLEEELSTVEGLYLEREKLYPVFKGRFPYIPKELARTFIEKYQKQEHDLDEVEHDLELIKKEIKTKLEKSRKELSNLEKLHELFKNKTDRDLDTLEKKIKQQVTILEKEQKLQEIKDSHNGNNELIKLLKPNAKVNKIIKNKISISNAIKLFKILEEEGKELEDNDLKKLKGAIKKHQTTLEIFIQAYNNIFNAIEDINGIKNKLQEALTELPTSGDNIANLSRLLSSYSTDDSDDESNDENEDDGKVVSVNILKLIKKIENIIGKEPSVEDGIEKPINQSSNHVLQTALKKHLAASTKYSLDSDYLKSLVEESFLVQVRVYKKLGRDMIKNVLMLSSGGIETIEINIPPGINTTLKITAGGTMSYHLGELGSYKNIGLFNLYTLQHYQEFLLSEEQVIGEKESEFKSLHQIEAIRNCSALLVNAMFFELATGEFVSPSSKQKYSFKNIAEQMPMSMEGAVAGTVYLEKQFSQFLPYQLKYDYREEGDLSKGNALAEKDAALLFDWLCYKLRNNQNLTLKIYNENDVVQNGWEFDQGKCTKGSYEVIFTKQTEDLDNEANQIEVYVISKVLQFPLNVFNKLTEDWYDIRIADLCEEESPVVLLGE